MFMLNPQDKTPIFSQLKKQILEFIGIGILNANDQLPSVRSLANELGINPNTVAKAYQELELQGYVYTVAGKGCFVSQVNIEADIQGDKIREFKQIVIECKKFNIDKKLLIKNIEMIYEGGTEDAKN